MLLIGPPPRFSTAAEVYAAITARFAVLKTARVHTVTTVADRELSTVEGVTRFGPSPAHDLTITVLPVAGEPPTSSRVLWVDGREYRMTVGADAAPGKPWSVRASAPAQVSVGPTTSSASAATRAPTNVLVDVVKGQAVYGVAVTGYRIRIGPTDSASDITYFLDDDNTVLKEEQRIDRDTVSTTTYSGFGVPADIVAPPAEQIARTS